MQEIRSVLRELPASQRLSLYLTTSDPLTLAAIEAAPMTLSAKRPDAVAKALATCPEPPDRVYLVETDGRPWYLFRLKEGADMYPNVRLHDYNTIEI